MVILFTLNPSGENLQVWTDLECSMGYKGKVKQLAFTMLITKQGESLCSYVWPEGTEGSRGAGIEKLTHCSFSVKMSKLVQKKGFLQPYTFSLIPITVASLGKRIKKGKFRAIFSSWCKACHESCRSCLLTTVFISHQWTFLIHIYFFLFHPVRTDGKTSKGREFPSCFTQNVKTSTSTLCF